MNKFEMQEYLEDNLDRIISNHFKLIEDEMYCEMYCEEYGLADLSKGTKYEVSIYLAKIEDEEEGEEISD